MFQEYSYGVLRKIQRDGTVRVFDKNPTAPTWFYTGGDERNRVSERGSLLPGVPAVLGGLTAPIQQVTLPPRGFYPGLQPALLAVLRQEAQEKVQAAQPRLRNREQHSRRPILCSCKRCRRLKRSTSRPASGRNKWVAEVRSRGGSRCCSTPPRDAASSITD